jgi:hypothetical protein
MTTIIILAILDLNVMLHITGLENCRPSLIATAIMPCKKIYMLKSISDIFIPLAIRDSTYTHGCTEEDKAIRQE